MKKVLIGINIILLSFFIMMFKVEAYTTAISGASIDGVNAVTTGMGFSQSFYVKFSDLKKASTDTLGIWLVGFELEYDESVFAIEETSNDGNVWQSIIYKEDGKVYVISEFSNDPFRNGCVDGVLYCADYLISIKFYVKNTDLTSSTIKMKQISAGAFQVSGDLNVSYSTDDMIELEYPNDVSKTINISKSTTATTDKEEPESIISNTVPKVETPQLPTPSTTTNSVEEKSNNKYLKSLSIENYEIDFSKETKTYEIYIKEEVNQLNITAISEDSNANIEIIGSDDLKKNNYKVLIKVKAENGDEETYSINVKINNEDDKKQVIKQEVNEKKENIKLNKKTIVIISIGIALAIIVISVLIILNHIDNKKIDKELDF